MAPGKFVLVASVQIHALSNQLLHRRKAKDLVVNQDWLMLVIVSLVIVLSASFLNNSRPAHAESNVPAASGYSCGSIQPLSGSHCYGINRWVGRTYGAYTAVDVVQLHAGNGVVNNSLWVGNQTHTHWIEAGYAVITSKNYEFWYFAYINNNGLYIEKDDPSGLVSGSGGDFGNAASINIKNVNGNVWSATVAGNASKWVPDTISLTNFAPDTIDLGDELGGSSGASAPIANYYDNQWRTSGGSYIFQFQMGAKPDYDSLSSDWTVTPPSSTTGGIWHTSI